MNRPISSLAFYFFPPLQAIKEAARWFLKVEVGVVRDPSVTPDLGSPARSRLLYGKKGTIHKKWGFNETTNIPLLRERRFP